MYTVQFIGPHYWNCFTFVFIPTITYTGQYLYEAVKAHDEYEIAFVWNRTIENLKGKIPANFVLEDLGKFASRSVLGVPINGNMGTSSTLWPVELQG